MTAASRSAWRINRDPRCSTGSTAGDVHSGPRPAGHEAARSQDTYGGPIRPWTRLAVIAAHGCGSARFNHIRLLPFPPVPDAEGQKTPTMSWHDSEEAWDAMRDMTGLDPTKGDECGNAAEFFRLCTRLAYLSGAVSNDVEATSHCEQKKTYGRGRRRGVKPKNWERPQGSRRIPTTPRSAASCARVFRSGHFLHHRPQVGLALEADAGCLRQGDPAVDDGAIVGEAAERREDLRIGICCCRIAGRRRC